MKWYRFLNPNNQYFNLCYAFKPLYWASHPTNHKKLCWVVFLKVSAFKICRFYYKFQRINTVLVLFKGQFSQISKNMLRLQTMKTFVLSVWRLKVWVKYGLCSLCVHLSMVNNIHFSPFWLWLRIFTHWQTHTHIDSFLLDQYVLYTGTLELSFHWTLIPLR